MSKNPNISIGFNQSAFQREVRAMADNLKTVKKEFEVTNLSIQANGDSLDVAKNKIEGYARQAEIQKQITEKVAEAHKKATEAYKNAGSRVEAAKKAYDKAAKSENASKEEVQKLKLELEKANNAYTRLGKAVSTWNNKLLDSQKAENKLKLAVKQTKDEIDKHNRSLSENLRHTRNVTSASGNLLNVYSLIKGLAIGYAGKTLYEALIGGNAEFEQYQTSFEVLLGSAELAREQMEKINTFAAKTPFEIEDITKASTVLLSYGVAQDKIMEKMQQLGDLSSGNADKLNTITLAYGKMVSTGKVTLEQLNMMTEAGIPIIKTLGSMFNKTGEEIYDSISKGQLSIESIDEAMKRLTSTGGQFYGMMDKQSKTMQGLLSTLKDNISMFARDVGEESFAYLKDSLQEFMDSIEDLSESGELGDIARDIGRGVGESVKFIVEAIKTLWNMKEALIAAGVAFAAFKVSMAISGTITAVVSAIKDYVKGVKAAAAATSLFNGIMSKTPWGLVISLAAAAVGGIIAYTAATGDAADETAKLSKKVRELTQEYDNNIESIEKQTNKQLGEITIAERLADELDDLSKKANKTTEEKARMAQVVDQLNEKIPNLSLAINAETGELNKQIGVVYDTIDAYKQLLFVKAAEKKSSEAAGQLFEIKDTKIELEQQLKELQKEYAGLSLPTNDEILNNPRAYQSQMQRAAALSAEMDLVLDEIKKVDTAVEQYESHIQKAFDMSKEYAGKYGSNGSAKVGGNPPPGVIPPPADTSDNNGVQKELDDLRFSRDMQYITESEYYKKLRQLRDQHYSEGSSEWQRYTLEIKNYQDRLSLQAQNAAKNAEQSEKDAFNKRRAASEQWIQDQKFYGQLTADQEIAAYESIKKYVDDYYARGIISYEEYTDQIKELDKDIFNVRKQLLDEQEKDEKSRRQAAIEAVNETQDNIVSALQNRYEKERSLKEEALNKDLADLDRWEKESIDRIKHVYDAKIDSIKRSSEAHVKALQAEIDALDRQKEMASREEQDKEELSKISSLQARIQFEHNDFNRAALQKELDAVLMERQKRLNEQELEDKKDALEKQIDAVKEAADEQIRKLEKKRDAELAAIEATYEAQKASIEATKENWDKFYEEKLSKASLSAEAEKLMMDQNQKEIIKLLTDYGDQYELVGQSLGEKLFNGFKPWTERISALVASALNSIESAKRAANEISMSSSFSAGGSGGQQSGNSITLNQTNNFNVPAERPSDTARKVQQASRKLAAELG